MHGKRVGNTSGIEYQGAMAKALPCSDRTMKTPLPQQSSSSAREEEGRLSELGQGNAEILRQLWASLNCKSGWAYWKIGIFCLASASAGNERKWATKRNFEARRRKSCVLPVGPGGTHS